MFNTLGFMRPLGNFSLRPLNIHLGAVAESQEISAG